ncbi:MAG: hypothetical protein IH612_03035 [Desulfofustis sp.]|nr:hypothetical protein [Desulfofustis sp.]
MKREVLEKILEYASMPVHGTLSRKLRQGVNLQVNEGRVYERAALFFGDGFIRITEENQGAMINTYYGWDDVASLRTLGVTDQRNSEDSTP